MTPNDKLPEDELTVQFLESISNEADEVTNEKANDRSMAYRYGYRDGYFIGATAWASWKVKHDELQAQAQRLADALEMTIRHAKECEELYNISGDAVIESAEAVLQQFKDGKGKEVERGNT